MARLAIHVALRHTQLAHALTHSVDENICMNIRYARSDAVGGGRGGLYAGLVHGAQEPVRDRRGAGFLAK